MVHDAFLSGDPQMAGGLMDMRETLNAWQLKTHDPLLTMGRGPLPSRAICATPQSYSTRSQVILPECRKNLEALREVLQNVVL